MINAFLEGCVVSHAVVQPVGFSISILYGEGGISLKLEGVIWFACGCFLEWVLPVEFMVYWEVCIIGCCGNGLNQCLSFVGEVFVDVCFDGYLLEYHSPICSFR